MPAIRHLFSHGLYISFVALLFSPCIAVAQNATVPAVRIEKGQIDVTFETVPQRRELIASVRISCQLRNTTSGPDKAQRTFPVAAPADWPHVQVSKTRYQVLVNGKPVEFETKASHEMGEQDPVDHPKTKPNAKPEPPISPPVVDSPETTPPPVVSEEATGDTQNGKRTTPKRNFCDEH